MKFKGEPNLYIRISNKYVHRVTRIKGFYFDDKGEYSTDNEILIKLLKQNFEVIEEVEEIKEVFEDKVEEIKMKHCKKCDFECENQGSLLAHYREIHPKEG